MRRITEDEIGNLLKLDYDSFLETITIQLISLCEEKDSLKDFMESLDGEVREDVLKTLRDLKLNSILDDEGS
jgi:hypothetical protein